MTIPTNKLDLAIYVRRHLRSETTSGRIVAGELAESAVYDDVIAALERNDLLGVSCDAQTRRVELRLPPTYFGSADALLVAADRRLNLPTRFYVEDLNLLYPDAVGDSDNARFIELYRAAASLFDVLKQLADYERADGKGAPVLVWLGQHQLEISAAYTAQDLRALPKLAKFVALFLTDTTHKTQKHGIVKDALLKLFHDTRQATLADVMKKFDALTDQAEAGYELYVSEFSFERVMSKVQKQKIDFTKRINAVLSEIQNQLLAIPVAVILVGGQMRPSDHLSLSNSLIWLGAAVFTVFVWFLVGNQLNTLDALHGEIDRQWTLIDGQQRAVAPRFKPAYDELERRCTRQKRLLYVVRAIVIIALLGTTWLLCRYSN